MMVDDKLQLNSLQQYLLDTVKYSGEHKDLLRLIRTMCRHSQNDIMFTRQQQIDLLEDRLRILMQFKQYDEQHTSLKKDIGQLQQDATPGSDTFKYAAALNTMICFYDNPKYKRQKKMLKQLLSTTYATLHADRNYLVIFEPPKKLFESMSSFESLKEYSAWLDKEIKNPALTKVMIDLCQQCFNPSLQSTARLWLIAIRQRFLREASDGAKFDAGMFDFTLEDKIPDMVNESEKKALKNTPYSALDYASFSEPLMRIFNQSGVTLLAPVFKLTYTFLDKVKMTIVQSQKKHNDAVSRITLGLPNTPKLLQTSSEDTVKKQNVML